VVATRDTETGDPARLPAEGDGDYNKVKKCTVRKIIFCTGLEQPRQDNNLLYRHVESNKPTKEGSLSFVLFESPFTSVSTVSRGHPSLVVTLCGGNSIILSSVRTGTGSSLGRS
jgi:hypothetical protein